jgi:hypothetical protein
VLAPGFRAIRSVSSSSAFTSLHFHLHIPDIFSNPVFGVIVEYINFAQRFVLLLCAAMYSHATGAGDTERAAP